MLLSVLLPSRSLCRAVVLLLTLAAACALRADDSPLAGTLPEDYLPGLKPILENAVKQSPTMIEADLKIEVANAQKQYNGTAPLLPHVSSNVYYGTYEDSVSNNSAASSRNSGFFGGISVNQTLFEWGTLKNQLEIQKILEAMAQKHYADGYRNWVRTLRQQYMGLIAGKMSLRNDRFYFSIVQHNFDLTSDRYKRGLIPRTDLINPQLQFEGSRISEEQSEANYADSLKAFAREIGAKEVTDDSIPTDIGDPKTAYTDDVGAPLPPFPWEDAAASLLATYLSGGVKNSYDAQVSELEIKRWDLAYRIARVRLLPQFSASASLSEQNQQNASPGSVSQTALTVKEYQVNGQWNMFDGFATKGVKREALYNKQIAQHSYEKLTEDLMTGAQQAKRNVEFAWRGLVLAERQYSISKFGYNDQKDRFARGLTSKDAFNDAQNSYNGAQLGHVRAVASFLQTWSDFVSQLGADPAMNNLPFRYDRPSP